MIIEAAVESVAEARAAEAAGVQRIELCGPPLSDGGTTPATEAIAACLAAVRVPVHVLVRPRVGTFVYTPDELRVIRSSVAAAKSMGAAGVAAGVLTTDGRIDVSAMREITAVARPMRVCFHRAFDQIRDQTGALETLVALGIEFVLTSGGAATAVEGAERLRELVVAARGRITIVAGGSVTRANATDLVARTGVEQVHGRAFVKPPLRVISA